MGLLGLCLVTPLRGCGGGGKAALVVGKKASVHLRRGFLKQRWVRFRGSGGRRRQWCFCSKGRLAMRAEVRFWGKPLRADVHRSRVVLATSWRGKVVQSVEKEKELVSVCSLHRLGHRLARLESGESRSLR